LQLVRILRRLVLVDLVGFSPENLCRYSGPNRKDIAENQNQGGIVIGYLFNFVQVAQPNYQANQNKTYQSECIDLHPLCVSRIGLHVIVRESALSKYRQ